MAATGEKVISIGGMDYVFTPTYKAIEAIEERAGVGLRRVWARIQNEGHVGTMATVLWAFNTNAGRSNQGRSIEHFGNLVIEHGMQLFLFPVAEMIAGVITRSAVDTEEPKEGETKSP